MRRRWLLVPFALAGLALLDTLAWRIGVDQLAAGTDRWIADARRQGWVVTDQGRAQGGWPFAATLALSFPQIAGGDAQLQGGVRWSAQRLLLAVSLFHPTRLVLQPGGAQRLRVSNLPELAVTWDAFAASVRLWGGAPDLARIDASGVSGGLAGPGHPAGVRIAALHLRLAAPGATRAGNWPSATLEGHAMGISLPNGARWALGALVSELGATLEVASLPAGLAGGSDAESQARAWRDGGGRLEARDVRLLWGTLRLAATATFTLDRHLQPSGSGTADVAGSGATLGALSQAGVITPGLASTAGAMLAFLPRAPGNADAIRLPLLLQDGSLSVGQIPVMQLGEIRWR